MVRKKVVVYEDEVSEKKWLKMVKVSEDSDGKRRIVKYDELIEKMNGEYLITDFTIVGNDKISFEEDSLFIPARS